MAYCSKFENKDYITGHTPERALNCRTDENKCGIIGRYFYERNAYENIFRDLIIPKIRKKIAIVFIVSSIIIRSIFY